jgi:hypothetical protein
MRRCGIRIGSIQVVQQTWQKIFLQTLCKCNDGEFGPSAFCDESNIIASQVSKNYGFIISYDGSDNTAELGRELFDQRLIEQPRGDSSALRIIEKGRDLCRQYETEHFKENLISKVSWKSV